MRTLAVDNIKEVIQQEKNIDDISLEDTIYLSLERVDTLGKEANRELSILEERRAKIARLGKIREAFNNAVNKKGEIHLKDHPELDAFFEEAKTLGVELNRQDKYKPAEKDCLLENIEMASKDLEALNRIKFPTVSRLLDERNKAYEMVKSFIDKLNDPKKSMARAMGGR